MKKVLLTATVQSHICQFHKPLSKLLKDNGYEVHVAARDNLKEKNGLQLEYVDKVFDVPFDRSPLSAKNIKAYFELKKIISNNHYDIVHCNTPVGGIITRLVSNKFRKNGTKVYYTAHGFHFYNGAPKKNWLIYYPIERFMTRFTDKLVTINDEDYKFAKTKFKCDTYRIHGVGVDKNKFFVQSNEKINNFKEHLGFSNEKIILNVGELLPNKNQKNAILAMKYVVEKFPDARLLIAGNGPLKNELQNLIDVNKLNNNVKLIGYNPNIYDYMNVCDLLVACSFREGLPLNVIEAMLCGKPVIGSINRGHNEIIKQGVNGYLVNPNDVEKIANFIIDVLSNSCFDDNQIIDSVNKYTVDNVKNELASVYGLEY